MPKVLLITQKHLQKRLLIQKLPISTYCTSLPPLSLISSPTTDNKNTVITGSASAKLGDGVVFSCDTMASPAATFTWKKDGAVIGEGGKSAPVEKVRTPACIFNFPSSRPACVFCSFYPNFTFKKTPSRSQQLKSFASFPSALFLYALLSRLNSQPARVPMT